MFPVNYWTAPMTELERRLITREAILYCYREVYDFEKIHKSLLLVGTRDDHYVDFNNAFSLLSLRLADLQEYASMADEWQRAQTQCITAGERMYLQHLTLFPVMRATADAARIRTLFELQGVTWCNCDMEAAFKSNHNTFLWRLPNDKYFCGVHETVAMVAKMELCLSVPTAVEAKTVREFLPHPAQCKWTKDNLLKIFCLPEPLDVLIAKAAEAYSVGGMGSRHIRAGLVYHQNPFKLMNVRAAASVLLGNDKE